ncbi:MAG: DoxX family protein [Planctomycetota bacterium]
MKSSLEGTGKFILRVAFGCLMLVHGVQKVSKYSDLVEAFPDPIGLGSQLSLISAIATELGCSIFLILGLLTRVVSVPLAFTMIIALFVVHADDPWQKKELAAVYLVAYIAILFLGPGKFSIDHLIWGKRADSLTSP